MKYPMVQRVVIDDDDYPYQFRFDLLDNGISSSIQIPELRCIVNSWLLELKIDYSYQHGLIWCLKNEQDAMLFVLRWA